MRSMKWIVTATFIITVACLVIVATGNIAMAKVSGQCSICHTMHNSQDGSDDGGNGAPRAFLTKAGMANVCVGCHTDGGNAAAPQIDINASSDPNGYVTGMSAGGTVLPTDSRKVHNIDDILSQDPNIGYTPPGWVSGSAGRAAVGTWLQQLSCAGTYGCHGRKDTLDMNAAIAGAHHTDDAVIDGNSVGSSYRFLEGILGYEDPNKDSFSGKLGYAWSDNKYSSDDGDPTPPGTAVPTATDTISYLCGQCHSNFHEVTNTDSYGTGASSPFVRHPSDIVIDDGRLEIPDADVLPVGYTDYGPTGTYLEANREGLLCISCHLSHGSIEDDILRFSYAAMDAGSGGVHGCLACHSNQR